MYLHVYIIHIHSVHVRFVPVSCVGRALGLESRVSWVLVPPEAADKKSSSGVVELC